MRNLPILLPVALVSAAAIAAPAPALADETYVEGTGGVIWNHEEANAVAAVTVGHDIDLSERFFVGGEGFAEKVLANDTRVVWGIGGRAGARVLAGAKLYAAANWQSKDCRECSDAVGLSAGWEQDLNEKVYAKLEYKHVLIGNGEPDSDIVAVGMGTKF